MLLRLLLQEWLRKTAGQAMREAIEKELGQRARPASAESNQNFLAAGESDKEADFYNSDVEFVLLFSTPLEASGVIDLLTDAVKSANPTCQEWIGDWRGRRIAVIVTGEDAEGIKQLARYALKQFQPTWFFSLGFATGLDPSIASGDLVVATEVIDQRGGILQLGLSMEEQVLQPHKSQLRVGRLLSLDRVLRSPEERAESFRESNALACDTESTVLANVCAEEEQPLIAIKIVSEAHDAELQDVFVRAPAGSSLARRLGATVGSIWRDPKVVKRILAERQKALELSDRLAEFTGTMLDQFEQSKSNSRE